MFAAASAATAALLTSVHDVFPRGDAHSELRRVHPVTLEPVGPPVRLAGFLRGGVARSPDRRRLALGVSARGRVQVVTGRRSKLVRTPRALHWLLAWPRDRRVLALGQDAERLSLTVLDPIAGRVLRRAPVLGNVFAGVPTADGLALLVAPPSRIGDAELSLVDSAGAERRIALTGIQAGFVPPDANGASRSVTPGLAVRGGIAYVATDSRVVEVDLTSGAQRSHLIAGARAAKPAEGSQRTIEPIGADHLLVSGADISGHVWRPIGLRVLDTRTWGMRVVARRATGATVLPDGGFAVWRRGLAFHRADGRPRARLLRGRRIVQLQVAGRYAYAVTLRPRHRTYVIELRSGRVVNTLPTARPGRILSGA